jgi:hypothetical protein
MQAYCRRTKGKDAPATVSGMGSSAPGQAQETLPAHQPRGLLLLLLRGWHLQRIRLALNLLKLFSIED